MRTNFSLDTPSFDEHLASIPRTWLRYPVGERYAYSNLGIDLAGWVLQKQAGHPFAELVRDRVLRPLGMERSRFATADLHDEPNRAVGMVAGSALSPEIPVLASGGLYSSANDLARFVRFQLDLGWPLLGEDSWGTMHEIAAPASDFQSRGYGLGVQILVRTDGRLVSAGHGGGGYGFSSFAAWMPELGVGFAVVQNSRDRIAVLQEVDRLFKKAVRALTPGDPLAEGLAVAEPVACLAADEDTAPPRGAWVGRGAQLVSIAQNGAFGILGSRFQPLCALGDGSFVEPSTGLRNAYRFETDAKGRARRLVGLNSGNVYDYNDGPDDPPGPSHPHWWRHLGTYEYARWACQYR